MNIPKPLPTGWRDIVRALFNKLFRRRKKAQSSIYPLR